MEGEASERKVSVSLARERKVMESYASMNNMVSHTSRLDVICRSSNFKFSIVTKSAPVFACRLILSAKMPGSRHNAGESAYTSAHAHGLSHMAQWVSTTADDLCGAVTASAIPPFDNSRWFSRPTISSQKELDLADTRSYARRCAFTITRDIRSSCASSLHF